MHQLFISHYFIIAHAVNVYTRMRLSERIICSHNGEETAAAQPGLHGGRGRLRWLHYFRIYPQAGQKIRSPQPLEQTAAGNGCFSVLVRKILSCRTSRGRCGVSTSTRRPTPAPSRLVGRGRKDGGSKPTSQNSFWPGTFSLLSLRTSSSCLLCLFLMYVSLFLSLSLALNRHSFITIGPRQSDRKATGLFRNTTAFEPTHPKVK